MRARMSGSKKLCLVVMVAALVLAGSASAVLAQAQYSITLFGINSNPMAINNAGTMICDITSSGGDAFYTYSAGRMTPVPYGFYSFAINGVGQLAGVGDSGYAGIYSGGQVTDLGTLGGSWSGAYGINDSGQVTGESGIAGDRSSHAFLYAGGHMTDIGTLGGTYSVGYAINSAGQVVGSAGTTGNSATHAFLYDGGHMTDLGTLGGATSDARWVNNAGQVVGAAQTADGHLHPFLYYNGHMADLGLLPGENESSADSAWALGINNAGQAVGYAMFYTTHDEHAFLYHDGVLQDLNDLIDPAWGWTLGQATGINDNGQIIGMATDMQGDYEGFLLTPTPEPATLGLLAAGLSALLMRRKQVGR